MRVEIHYDNGDVQALKGDSTMAYVICTDPDDAVRATLGLGGKLDALGVCLLLTLLEMQLGDSSEILEIGVGLWQEQRERLIAEAVLCRARQEGEEGERDG